MVDQPIAACHARLQKIQDPIQLALLTLAWIVIAALGQPGFAASEAIPTERTLIAPAFVQQAYIKASNTDARDRFGEVLAIDGDTMVIGVQLEDSSASGVNGDQSNDPSDPTRFDAGAAYVFVRDELGGWSQQAYLKASNTDLDDRFGAAVAISGDTIVVGARGEDSNATGVNGDESDNSSSGAGAAYVFVRNGTTWAQQAYLKASNTDSLDSFGAGVAISDDTIVVTAPAEDSLATGVNGDQGNGASITQPQTGAAYVFVRDELGTWTQQAYLKASNTDLRDGFGGSVAISGDTIVVGTRSEDSGDASNELDNSEASAGAAYVFVRNAATWSQQAYLKASDPEENDQFGASVSISGDTIVVGAANEDSNAIGINGDESDNSLMDSGAAYVFNRSGTTWSQQAYLKASNADSNFDDDAGEFAGDRFGQSVSVSGDSIIVGADAEDSSSTGVDGDQSDDSLFNAGAAYVFVRDGSAWSQQAYLKASNPDVQDAFGVTVSISDDTVVVGAPSEDSGATGVDGDQDDESVFNSGAIYVFTFNAADLVLEKTSGSFFTQPGGTINYEILVVNTGPSNVVGAQVTDTPPPVLSNVTWDCMAIDGATCQDADGADEIDQTVDIPNGGAVMFTLSGTLPPTGNQPVINTASVSNPITELNPSDNTDSDTDLVGLFADGMESEEP